MLRRDLLRTFLVSAAAGLAACTAGGARNPRVTGPGADEADDTAALQRMLDQLSPGDTLVLPNATYRHRDVLVVRVPGTRIVGPGATLLATREDRSAFRIDADDVAVEGLVLAVESTTRRWDALAQHKVLLSGHRDIALRDVTVTGSAASGIFVDGAEDFLLERTTVTDTRADGIHLTAGAHDGRVVDAVTRGTGDDGIAVVSYEGTPPCRRIEITSPEVRANTHGRGLSVVGGEDISFRDVLVEDSAAAAVYVAVEGAPFDTLTTRAVTVQGGRLVRSNTDPSIDHGAVLIFSARRGHAVERVLIEGLTIMGTRDGASRQVGLLTAGGDIEDVTLDGLTITGGPPVAFSSEVAPSSFRILGWQVDGKPFYVRDPPGGRADQDHRELVGVGRAVGRTVPQPGQRHRHPPRPPLRGGVARHDECAGPPREESLDEQAARPRGPARARQDHRRYHPADLRTGPGGAEAVQHHHVQLARRRREHRPGDGHLPAVRAMHQGQALDVVCRTGRHHVQRGQRGEVGRDADPLRVSRHGPPAARPRGSRAPRRPTTGEPPRAASARRTDRRPSHAPRRPGPGRAPPRHARPRPRTARGPPT